MFKSVILASVFALSVGTANAASFDFSAASTGFSFGDNLGGSEVFTGSFGTGDVTVTASALSDSGTVGPNDFDGNLIQFNTGIGVRNGPNDGSNQVEGSGDSEGIRFFFSKAVDVLSIEFGGVDGNDDVTVWTNPAGSGVFVNSATDLPIGNDDSIQFFTGLLDRVVVIALESNDNWIVTGINIAPVPVPAAGVLFASALGLAGLYRRRKSLSAS